MSNRPGRKRLPKPAAAKVVPEAKPKPPAKSARTGSKAAAKPPAKATKAPARRSSRPPAAAPTVVQDPSQPAAEPELAAPLKPAPKPRRKAPTSRAPSAPEATTSAAGAAAAEAVPASPLDGDGTGPALPVAGAIVVAPPPVADEPKPVEPVATARAVPVPVPYSEIRSTITTVDPRQWRQPSRAPHAVPITPPARESVWTYLSAGAFGWLVPAAGIGSAGLLAVAGAFALSRVGFDGSVYLFWAGLLALFVPVTLGLLGERATRTERVVALVWLAIGLYAVKILHSPTSLDFYDELQHWRTAADIASSGRLFQENTMLLTSSLFPGLEIVGVALSQLSGASIDGAGLLTVGIARVALVLALFLVFEVASRSAWIAGVATLIYLANPSFLFFDAQFAYESMALSLGAFVILLLAMRSQRDNRYRVGLTLAALVMLAALMVTHHLTSYVIAAMLVLWALAGFVTRGYRETMGVGGMALIGLVMVLTWLGYVASITVSYLVAPVGGAVASFVKLLLREQEGRALFEAANAGGIVALPWERVLGFAAAIIITLLLPFGAWQLWRATRGAGGLVARFQAIDPLALTLLLVSLAYPATLALRFTERGAELSSRAASTLFVAVGLTCALALGAALVGRQSARRAALAAAALTVVLVGNVVVGWAPWQRLPGPFLVGADSRSINGESEALAEWARDVLGDAQRFGADRTNTLLLGSHGMQWIVWYQSTGVDLSPLWFSPRLGAAEIGRIREADLEYLVVDTRLAEDLPQTGVYFDRLELNDGAHASPIPAAYLSKFDSTDGVSRIYDSGNIRVYDLRGLLDAD